MAQHPNRETWLLASLPGLCGIITSNGGNSFPQPLVSVGFPHGKRGSAKGKTIGQCWTIPSQECAHIFVHPCIADGLQVLEILIHELVHAAVGCQHGHRKPFARVARAIGLEGKLTATVAGDVLRGKLETIALGLGEFPHQKLDPDEIEKARKKQSTRYRKYVCPGCQQILRAAKSELEVACVPCSRESGELVEFVMEGGEDEDEDEDG